MPKVIVIVVNEGGGYNVLGVASNPASADQLVGRVTREKGLYTSQIHYYEAEVDKDVADYGVAGKELDVTKREK